MRTRTNIPGKMAPSGLGIVISAGKVRVALAAALQLGLLG